MTDKATQYWQCSNLCSTTFCEDENERLCNERFNDPYSARRKNECKIYSKSGGTVLVGGVILLWSYELHFKTVDLLFFYFIFFKLINKNCFYS